MDTYCIRLRNGRQRHRPASRTPLRTATFSLFIRSAVHQPSQHAASVIAVRCISHRSALHRLSQHAASSHAAHCVFRRFPSAVFCEFVFPVCLPCMPVSIKVLPGLAGKLHLRLALRSSWHSGQIPLIMRLMA